MFLIFFFAMPCEQSRWILSFEGQANKLFCSYRTFSLYLAALLTNGSGEGSPSRGVAYPVGMGLLLFTVRVTLIWLVTGSPHQPPVPLQHVTDGNIPNKLNREQYFNFLCKTNWYLTLENVSGCDLIQWPPYLLGKLFASLQMTQSEKPFSHKFDMIIQLFCSKCYTPSKRKFTPQTAQD